MRNNDKKRLKTEKFMCEENAYDKIVNKLV